MRTDLVEPIVKHIGRGWERTCVELIPQEYRIPEYGSRLCALDIRQPNGDAVKSQQVEHLPIGSKASPKLPSKAEGYGQSEEGVEDIATGCKKSLHSSCVRTDEQHVQAMCSGRR